MSELLNSSFFAGTVTGFLLLLVVGGCLAGVIAWIARDCDHD